MRLSNPSLYRLACCLLAAAIAPVAPAVAQTPPPASPPAAAPPAAPQQSQQPAGQQPASVERSVTGQPDKDIRVGVYVNVKADCSSGPLPTIRLVEPPAHGKVDVRSAKISARNYKQCLALEVQGYSAFYRSAPNFTGTDSFLLEVKYAGGRTENQKISVTVSTTAAPAVPGAPKAPAPPRQQSI